jgi:hypothetical protein
VVLGFDARTTIAATTIWRLLRRQQLGTRRARLAVMERASATQGLLTERTVTPARHVAAQAPGDLLSLDTFYVGKLNGVGKVRQITGCDVASSFAWAHLVLGARSPRRHWQRSQNFVRCARVEAIAAFV